MIRIKSFAISLSCIFFTFSSYGININLYPSPDICNESVGSVTTMVTGGVPPYIYLWSNGATTADLQNIPAGMYNLTVYDSTGDSAVQSIMVSNLSNIPLSTLYSDAAHKYPCFNQCNGVIVLATNNFSNVNLWGTPPHTFTSSQGNVNYNSQYLQGNPGVGIENICGNTNVNVQVTDALGCTGQATLNLFEAPEVVNPIILTTPSCNSLSNGSVTIDSIPNWFWLNRSLNITSSTISNCNYNNYSLPHTFNNLLSGNYFLQVCYPTHTIDGCTQYFPFIIADLGTNCSTVQGYVFVDLNSDCIQDSGEVGIPNVLLEFTPGPFYAITNNSGFFTTNLPVGTYTVTQQLPPNLFQTCTSAPTTFTLSAGTPNYLINFADSSNIPLDIEAFLGSGIARPGFDFNYSLNIKNLSYEQSGLLTVTFDYDPLLTFVVANPTPLSTSPGQVVWQLNSIQNFASSYASVTLNVPANPALIGDTLTASINVVAANSENDLSNNTKIYNHIITGSFDPNEKHVTPDGNFIPALDNILDYTIFFQNTGNDTAFNVVIIDTLDTNLDVTTFVPGVASHAFETELSGQGIVKFLFNNILLPDSIVDEPNSHGFISFTIQTVENLPHNTIISNKSDIIFDFNPPITTNAVQSIVDLSLAIDASATTICEGESITLTMIPELQNSNTTWGWRSGSCTGGLIGFGNSITVSPSVTTTYFVRDSLNSIPATSCYRKTIIVIPGASSTQNISICDGQSITVGTSIYTTSGTYIDSLQTVMGCDSVITTNLNVLPDLSSTQVIIICNGENITVGTSTYSTSGIYVDVFSAMNGCDSTVITDLTVQLSIDTTLSVVDSLVVSNVSGGSYQWVDCANNYLPIPGETAQAFYPFYNGYYGVIITQNGCVDTSECILILGVDISEIENNPFIIYPNPTTGHIIVESEIVGNKIIEVTDVLGTVIIINSSTEKKTAIDLFSQSKGIYFIKIILGENVKVVKIIYY